MKFKHSLTVILAFTLMLTIAYNAYSAPFKGLVTQVHDGDTLTVLNEKGAAEKIRLYRVDSPEMPYSTVPYQPYASEARTGLLNLCLSQVATIERKGISYGRSVATVECKGIDVSTYQVTNGNAWVYRYTKTKALTKLQAAAMQTHLGLWSLPAPVEPYLWRKGTR